MLVNSNEQINHWNLQTIYQN